MVGVFAKQEVTGHEAESFPVSSQDFPVRMQKFPVPFSREKLGIYSEILVLAARERPDRLEYKIFPCIFPQNRETWLETGSRQTHTTTT